MAGISKSNYGRYLPIVVGIIVYHGRPIYSLLLRSSRHSIQHFNKYLEVFSVSRVSIGGYWYLTTYPQLSTCARYCCLESGMTHRTRRIGYSDSNRKLMADTTHDYECNLRSRTINHISLDPNTNPAFRTFDSRIPN